MYAMFVHGTHCVAQPARLHGTTHGQTCYYEVIIELYCNVLYLEEVWVFQCAQQFETGVK